MAETDKQPISDPIKTKRDVLNDRLKRKYPDMDMSDEEAYYGRINDDYDVYDKQLEAYKKRDSDLSNMFLTDPRSASYFMDWRKGEDPVIGMMRKFGDEFRVALDDPEKQEALAKARAEYLDRVANEKKLQEEAEKNLDESFDTMDKVQEEMGLTEEEMNGVVEKIIEISNEAIVNKFSAETLKTMIRALHYDKDVASANHEGEVRGRNQRITEKLKKKQEGDGTPNLGGRNGGRERPQAPNLGALDNIGRRKSIWDQGEPEVRTKAK